MMRSVVVFSLLCFFGLGAVPSFAQANMPPDTSETVRVRQPFIVVKISPLSPAIGLLTPSANMAVECYLHPKHSLQAEAGYLYSYKTENLRVFGQNGYRFRGEYRFYPYSTAQNGNGFYMGVVAGFQNRFVDRQDWVERDGGAYTQLTRYKKQMRYWGGFINAGGVYFAGKKKRLAIDFGCMIGAYKKTVVNHLPDDAAILINRGWFFSRLNIFLAENDGVHVIPNMGVTFRLGYCFVQ